MKATLEHRAARAPAAAAKVVSPQPQGMGAWAELRAILLPRQRWHYIFHAVVAASALWYWVGSLLLLPDASWAEIVMYRPHGDNQVWPVVTALSRFNFGDPTDAFNYGKGIGGFHAVILLPYALAYAVFGAPGYMVVDVFVALTYFVAAAMLLRVWGLARTPALCLSAALATQALSVVLQQISGSLGKLIAVFGRTMAEWDFPDLLSLSLFSHRIPRPFPTEIFVVLTLYLLSRIWLGQSRMSLKQGIALGVAMGLLAQGDPYSFAALGLLGAATVGRAMVQQRARIPWAFGLGTLAGAAAVGWYFVIQLSQQNPESAVRFGLATFSRAQIFLLPGYAPWLRLIVVGTLVWLVFRLTARARQHTDAKGAAAEAVKPTDAALLSLAIIVAALLAKPVQLWLLGKGAQTYHYLLFTLPAMYGYAVVLLIIQLGRLSRGHGERAAEARLAQPGPGWSKALYGGAAGLMFVLGIDDANETIKFSGVSRREVTPWLLVGDLYRPAFRALDKQFREDPALKESRTFATFCHEVNFLLAAFHDKRAYLPDNGFTTLSDHELEKRLFVSAKLCRIDPDSFAAMIQDGQTMNFWLGCAKYWFTPEHKFAPDDDYAPEMIGPMRSRPRGTGFNLTLPRSEFDRLSMAYYDFYRHPSPPDEGPDTIVLTSMLKQRGFRGDPRVYREAYTNDVFTVYTRVNLK